MVKPSDNIYIQLNFEDIVCQVELWLMATTRVESGISKRDSSSLNGLWREFMPLTNLINRFPYHLQHLAPGSKHKC